MGNCNHMESSSQFKYQNNHQIKHTSESQINCHSIPVIPINTFSSPNQNIDDIPNDDLGILEIPSPNSHQFIIDIVNDKNSKRSSSKIEDKEKFAISTSDINILHYENDKEDKIYKDCQLLQRSESLIISNNNKKIFANGSYYDGEWDFTADKMEGKGKIIYKNGDYFEGNWKNNKANGYGKYVNKNGGWYEGNWKDDFQNGMGIEITPDFKYEGEFFRGKKHGKGIINFTDGSIYEGLFKENLIEGFGKYIWPNQSVYEGEWKNNLMDGFGKYYYFNHNKKYIGYFKDDLPNGIGFMKYKDKKYFCGMFKNGVENGYGILFDNQENTKGFWKKGNKIDDYELDENEFEIFQKFMKEKIDDNDLL